LSELIDPLQYNCQYWADSFTLHLVSSLPTSECNSAINVTKRLTNFNPRQMWQYSCEKNTKLKRTGEKREQCGGVLWELVFLGVTKLMKHGQMTYSKPWVLHII